MKSLSLIVAALALAACTNDRNGAGGPAAASAPLPSAAEVQAIEAEAQKAADGVSAENADAKLDELERALADEQDG